MSGDALDDGAAATVEAGPEASVAPPRGPAGSRSADWAFHFTSRYRPEPTGALLNGEPASSVTATSPRRWAGSSGCRAASRNPPSAVLSVNRTVRSLILLGVTSAQEAASGPA